MMQAFDKVKNVRRVSFRWRSKHPPGEQWPNPYNRRVIMISIPSRPVADGWQQASYRFLEPEAVVAIWLMAIIPVQYLVSTSGILFWTSRFRKVASDR